MRPTLIYFFNAFNLMSLFDEDRQRERDLRLKEVLVVTARFEYDDKHYCNPFTHEQMTNTNWVSTLGRLMNDIKCGCGDFEYTRESIHDKLVNYIQSNDFDIEEIKQNKQLAKAYNNLLYCDYTYMYANHYNKQFDPETYAVYYVLNRFPQVLTKEYFNIVAASVWLASFEIRFGRKLCEIIEGFDLEQQKETIGLISSCEALIDIEQFVARSNKLKAVYNTMKDTIKQDYPDLQHEYIHDYYNENLNEVNAIYKQFLGIE